jgi:hypothetical protein
MGTIGAGLEADAGGAAESPPPPPQEDNKSTAIVLINTMNNKAFLLNLIDFILLITDRLSAINIPDPRDRTSMKFLYIMAG